MWSSIRTWWAGIRSKLLFFFSAGLDAVAQAVKEAAPKIEGDAVAFFTDAAKEAVEKAANYNGSNSDRFDVAFSSITDAFATKGVTLAENVATLLIETAYANFKAGRQ